MCPEKTSCCIKSVAKLYHISWWLGLFLGKTGVPRENFRCHSSYSQTLSHILVVSLIGRLNWGTQRKLPISFKL